MVTEGFTRRSTAAVDTQPVAIVGVDLATRQAQGMTRVGTAVTIDCGYGVGGHLVTPSVGEQWYVERVDRVWRLGQKIPFNDNNLLIEPVEGQTVVGGTGPIELNGSQVNVHSPMDVTGAVTLNSSLGVEGAVTVSGALTLDAPVSANGSVNINGSFTLGETHYRDNNGTLEYQVGGNPWIRVGDPKFYDINYIHRLSTSTRAVGYGDNTMGVRIPRAVVLTSVTYRCATNDSGGGDTNVELRKNGSTVTGSGVTLTGAAQVTGGTATGTWSFSAGDILTVYVSAVGYGTIGKGLVADIHGTVT